MSEIQIGYPLQWPRNWKRTLPHNRKASKFRVLFGKARDQLLNEIRLLGGTHPVISSNIQLRQDGIPYATKGEPLDSGVAVYFRLFGKQQCIPCDKWRKVGENLTAIGKTVEALRGIERWGAKDMVEAAFTGFLALPPPSEGIKYFEGVPRTELMTRYRELAKKLHPDVGGDAVSFSEMQRQFQEANQ